MGKAGKKKRNKPRHAPAHFSVPDNPDRAPETAVCLQLKGIAM